MRDDIFDLAHTANTSGGATGRPRTGPRQGLRPGVQRILDSISITAYVRNGRMNTSSESTD